MQLVIKLLYILKAVKILLKGAKFTGFNVKIKVLFCGTISSHNHL